MVSFDNATTLGDVRRLIRDSLTPKYGEREAIEMARIIMMHLKGWNLNQLLAFEDREPSDFIKGSAASIVNQLLQDVPLQYILGETTFYGLKIGVKPGVLIPRPETEELVDMIVKENQQPDLKILDLCTGSGAIALALSRNIPFSKVEGIDISPTAIEVAKENAKSLKVNVEIEKADIFSFSEHKGAFDIIVSNPPYVDESEKHDMEANVLEHEPHEALFVPDDNPLLFYKRIAEIGNETLSDGGKLYLEINPRHAAELKEMLTETGYGKVEIHKDIHGKDRFATGTYYNARHDS